MLRLQTIRRNPARLIVSEERRLLTSGGTVGCQLKTLFHDRTMHVIFEPLDFAAQAIRKD